MIVLLIVDDEKLQRLTISHILKKNIPDIKIVEAVDGNDAVEKILENKCEIILMDITMPNCDGIEATKIIRMINKNIKIFALTAANITSDFKKKCLDAGMNGFMNKPFRQYNALYIKKYFN